MRRKVIEELDKPKKVYRLTYTITEMDGGKRVGAEHFEWLVAEGAKAVLKQGSRVPIVTGVATIPGLERKTPRCSIRTWG